VFKNLFLDSICNIHKFIEMGADPELFSIINLTKEISMSETDSFKIKIWYLFSLGQTNTNFLLFPTRTYP